MKNLDKSLFSCCLASSITSAFLALPLFAAENQGSLDNMWSDQKIQTNQTAQENSSTDAPPKLNGAIEPNNQASSNTPPNTQKASPSDQDRTADATNPTPLDREGNETATQESTVCRLDDFLHSNIVLGTSWPNIGPFKTTTPGPYSLIDPSLNRIGLSVGDNKVVAAELDLAADNNPAESFTNLEMSTDFLMEALGTKAKKIHDINLQLEANTAVIKGTFTGPIGLIADPYVITINKDGTAKIRVSNRQVPGAESAVITMADLSHVNVAEKTNLPPTHRAPVKHTAGNAVAPVAPSNNSGVTANQASEKYEDLLNKITGDHSIATGSDSPPRGLASARTEGRKKEFLDLIQSWQRLKKTAVRQRETADLPKILAGAALARQSNAIKWLAANHKYYDMTPKGAQVDRIEEEVPDTKYFVYAQVKESSKYVEEGSGQVLKDSDETYNVRYTVEKAGDRWVISDSALTKPSGTSPPASAKPPR